MSDIDTTQVDQLIQAEDEKERAAALEAQFAAMPIMFQWETARVLDTDMLLKLNEYQTEWGASRVLDPYELLDIDPDGLHIIGEVRLMFLPFSRCQVIVRTRAGEPVLVWLDLSMEQYRALPLLSVVLDREDDEDEDEEEDWDDDE